MASKKVKDLAVRTGEYVDGSGQTKGRFENVGSMFKKDDGSFFLMMKKTFNPAGVETEAGRDSIIIGVFDLRENDAAPAAKAAPAARAAAPAPAAADDDIPF